MATSITQAKPLLTAAELELFEHSRAEPVKAFNEKQLAGKEKRTRDLRDKYRDLFQRQSVAAKGKATGKKAAGSGQAAGAASEANARTQRKAEIMEEMLARFEARSALLQTRAERGAEVAGKSEKIAQADKADKAKGAHASRANKTDKAVKAKVPPPVTKRAAPAASPASTKAVAVEKAKTQTDKKFKAPATKWVSTALGQPPLKTGHPSDQDQAALSAVGHVHNEPDEPAHVEHLTGHDPVERSHKAPSDKSPARGGKAAAPQLHAPLDTVPAAERGNPLKNAPGNIAIQGHISSSVRRAQGKRDSR